MEGVVEGECKKAKREGNGEDEQYEYFINKPVSVKCESRISI
jgi:hypothetical protein